MTEGCDATTSGAFSRTTPLYIGAVGADGADHQPDGLVLVDAFAEQRCHDAAADLSGAHIVGAALGHDVADGVSGLDGVLRGIELEAQFSDQ